MIELLEAERSVAETHALIERQRRLIEELACEDHSITSEQIVFDSLCLSLSLHVQNRNRFRTQLNDLPPFQWAPVVGSKSQEVSDGEGKAAFLYRGFQTANG